MAMLSLAVMWLATTFVTSLSLLKAPGPTLYVAPVRHNGQLFGPLGQTLKSGNSSWYLAQWNNPVPWSQTEVDHLQFKNSTPPSSKCRSSQGAPEWSIESETTRVCVNGAEKLKVVQLASTGRSKLKCGIEFDWFLAPIGSAYPTYSPNFLPASDNFLPLSALSKVTLRFSVALEFLNITSRCGVFPQCSSTPDYAYMTVGLPLSNPKKKQTIFFQIGIFDSRGSSCGSGPNMCLTNKPFGWYFRSLPVLGVNVAAASLPGGMCLQQASSKAGNMHTMTIDVLPSLLAAVTEGHKRFNADGNMSNWRVNSLYVGQGLQGSATITSSWTNISLDVYQHDD